MFCENIHKTIVDLFSVPCVDVHSLGLNLAKHSVNTSLLLRDVIY